MRILEAERPHSAPEYDLRVALLSVHDQTTDTRATPAPYRLIAGARLVDRQLDLALAAGCETIACLATTIGREVMALQHRAEEAGARFIVVSAPRKLSGLVSAADELLVLAPGILPVDDAFLRHMNRPAVLVFPAAPAVARGYERIDANFAWAGALLTRGNAVEQLAHLPDDVDVPSALLRITLQSGVRTHPLDQRLIEDGNWLRDPDAGEIAAREKTWVANHAQVAPFSAPGLAIAERMAARLARDAMGEGLVRLLSLGAALAALLAVSLALAGWLIPGFAAATLAALLVAMDEVVRRIALAGQVRPRVSFLRQLLAMAIDPVLVVLIALASPEDTEWLRIFVPAVLFGLLHLGERLSMQKWRRTYSDRVSLALILIPAVVLGVVQPFAAALALAVLVSLFLASGGRD